MISYRQADLFERMKPKAHAKHEQVNLLDLRKDVDEERKVIYLPQHVHGDWYHDDAEMGRITSWNHKFVFVNFGKGDTSAACDPKDLYWCFDYPVEAVHGGDHAKTIGTLYKMPYGGNPSNMRWAANPDGFKDSIRFWVSNPNDIPENLRQERKRIPVSFNPQDQYCRYEP